MTQVTIEEFQIHFRPDKLSLKMGVYFAKQLFLLTCLIKSLQDKKCTGSLSKLLTKHTESAQKFYINNFLHTKYERPLVIE